MSPKTRLAIIVVIIGGALAARYYFNPNKNAVSGNGAPIAQVVVPMLPANIRQGQTLFDENCASCHGKNAAGQEGIAPPLINKIYRNAMHGDGAFLIAAREGVRAHHWQFGNMPPIEGVSAKDIDKIVAYIRTLQVANGIK